MSERLQSYKERLNAAVALKTPDNSNDAVVAVEDPQPTGE
jgi:hypothetical protein